MYIREMTIDGIPSVRKIGDNAPELSVSEENTPFWGEARLTSWVAAKQDVMIVAEENGEVIGFQITQIHSPSQTGYLSDVAVVESARGKGVGSALIQSALERMRKMGITYVYALTQTDNTKIHRLLTKYGLQKQEAMTWFDADLQ